MRVRFQTKILLLVLAGVSLPALLMGWYLLQRNEELLAEKVQETLSNHLFLEATAPALAACPWAAGGAGGPGDVPAEHLPWPAPFEAAAQVAGGELRLSGDAGLGLTARADLITRHRVS